MTEHIREEYALRKPDGEIFGNWWPEHWSGDRSRRAAEELREGFPQHNLTVVHRTVTFTDWEAVE